MTTWRKSTYSAGNGSDCVEVGKSDPVEMWRKSTYSGDNGSDCVEVGESGPAVLVRDTKNRSGVVLRFGLDEWRRFGVGIKDADKA